MGRIGIFGGTFDPIHFGHLRMAEEAREQVALDRVLFVPNRVSPLKGHAPVTPPELRGEMVALAIADHPAFVLSPIEIERPGPSYTVDTVRVLRDAHPSDALFFLTGSDAIRDLPRWHDPDTLLSLAHFVALARPGTDPNAVLTTLPPRWKERVTFMAMPGLDISATDLRARVRAGRSLRYLVPPEVAGFIRARGLYQEPIQGLGGE